MKWLASLIVVFALAVAVSLAAHYGEGYALIVYPPYRIEISLAFAILLLLALIGAVHVSLNLAQHMMRLPESVAAYRRRRRHTRGQEALRGAWQALLEGRYSKSEKLAGRAYALDEAPALAAITAARAAHFMRQTERRDGWLARAGGADGDLRAARLATQAELALDERRFDEARTTLHELHESGPRHVATLRLLLRAEQGLQNWDEVLRLARLLEKRRALPPEAVAQLRVSATIENLRKKGLDADSLAAFWDELPGEERREPRVASAAARHFIRLGGCRRAHKLIAEALTAQWSPELVALYGECRDDDAIERLQLAERWLVERPRDAALLLTLGRLCAYRELWGKAQSYLEASVSVQPTRTAHLELARLLDRIGRESDAARHYRAATDSALPS
jgi:HemY protein